MRSLFEQCSKSKKTADQYRKEGIDFSNVSTKKIYTRLLELEQVVEQANMCKLEGSETFQNLFETLKVHTKNPTRRLETQNRLKNVLIDTFEQRLKGCASVWVKEWNKLQVSVGANEYNFRRLLKHTKGSSRHWLPFMNRGDQQLELFKQVEQESGKSLASAVNRVNIILAIIDSNRHVTHNEELGLKDEKTGRLTLTEEVMNQYYRYYLDEPCRTIVAGSAGDFLRMVSTALGSVKLTESLFPELNDKESDQLDYLPPLVQAILESQSARRRRLMVVRCVLNRSKSMRSAERSSPSLTSF